MTFFTVLVDVYHKEQLMTKEEAQDITTFIYNWEWRWLDVAITKDGRTATRIAEILDEYGFNSVAQHLRGRCVHSCLCV